MYITSVSNNGQCWQVLITDSNDRYSIFVFSLVPPIFLKFAEAKIHLSSDHKMDSDDDVSANVIFPIDFRRAKCRNCSQVQ